MTRHATSLALGALGGIAGVLAIGFGYVLHDWQRAARRTLPPHRHH